MPLVAVLVEQVPQVPRAVADVDLGVVEVGDPEPVPPVRCAIVSPVAGCICISPIAPDLRARVRAKRLSS